VSRSIAYASMIKSVDPTALIAGPGDFVMHYQGDGKPGDGKKEHGGLGQGNYYLQQMRAYEMSHGRRILDYFDEHYYPLNQDGQTPDTILECTRSLWDPTYKEKNWVGKWMGAKEIIPSFHRWVDAYYPGTKISISEYGWGDNKTLIGALAQADVLGIFGRERLDMACAWGAPRAKEPGANAFRIYLNYDGHGSRYGDVWVKSVSEDQSRVSIYGAQRTVDNELTLVIINKTHDELTSAVSLAHFHPRGLAKVFQFGKDNLNALVAEPDQKIMPTGFTRSFSAQSMTMIAIPGR
jgi:phage protein U